MPVRQAEAQLSTDKSLLFISTLRQHVRKIRLNLWLSWGTYIIAATSPICLILQMMVHIDGKSDNEKNLSVSYTVFWSRRASDTFQPIRNAHVINPFTGLVINLNKILTGPQNLNIETRDFVKLNGCGLVQRHTIKGFSDCRGGIEGLPTYKSEALICLLNTLLRNSWIAFWQFENW